MTMRPVAVADAFQFAGFAAFVTGLWLQFGAGWALIIGGVILFCAAGLSLPRAR